MKRAEANATHHVVLCNARGCAGPVKIGGADRVDRRVQRLDARDARVHQFDGRNLPRADHATQFDGGVVRKACVGHAGYGLL